MNGVKGLSKSTTILGGLLALVPAFDVFLSQIGVLPAGILPDSVALLTSTLGGALAIIGRVRATKQIKGL